MVQRGLRNKRRGGSRCSFGLFGSWLFSGFLGGRLFGSWLFSGYFFSSGLFSRCSFFRCGLLGGYFFSSDFFSRCSFFRCRLLGGYFFSSDFFGRCSFLRWRSFFRCGFLGGYFFSRCSFFRCGFFSGRFFSGQFFCSCHTMLLNQVEYSTIGKRISLVGRPDAIHDTGSVTHRHELGSSTQHAAQMALSDGECCEYGSHICFKNRPVPFNPKTRHRPIGTQSRGFRRSCVPSSGQSFRSSRGMGFPRWGTRLPNRFGWRGDWRCSAGSL
jgi:hypothetical protein